MTGITFHWHGVRQIRTPAMDGPSMITQCPIPFATTFTYSFQATESGTFFWHSHIGSNRVDGLAGPLIVRSIVCSSFRFYITLNEIFERTDFVDVITGSSFGRRFFTRKWARLMVLKKGNY